MEYYKIRRWRKLLRATRATRKALAPISRAMKWAARYMGWLKYANPKRYVNILDRYIIRKFI